MNAAIQRKKPTIEGPRKQFTMELPLDVHVFLEYVAARQRRPMRALVWELLQPGLAELRREMEQELT